MKKLNKNFLIGAIVILILGVLMLFLGIYKARQNISPNNPSTPSFGETEYKVNIDAKDCLTEEEADKLIEWGTYKDNEKMIYIDNNEKHPIQVWKIKLKDGQEAAGLMRILLREKSQFVDKITDNEEMKETLMSQYGSTIGSGGNVVTMIISNHLEEAKEQTSNWLKD